jgi:hypothetical protein
VAPPVVPESPALVALEEASPFCAFPPQPAKAPANNGAPATSHPASRA